MIRKIRHRRRQGAAAVEFAVVAPVLLFLLCFILVGGVGVFRYEQVALLAREGARYASVHGRDYNNETGQPSATPDSVYTTAIQPLIAGMEADRLTYSVTWADSSQSPTYLDSANHVRSNSVTVTVSYQWNALGLLPRSITLSSTSEMPMSF